MKLLHNHCSRVPSGMRAEHLKRWIVTTRKKEKEDAEAGEEMAESNRGGETMEDTSTEASNCAMVVELV